MLEEKEETSPTEEETQNIGKTFVQNYVLFLIEIIAQFKNALRRGGTPLPSNNYAVASKYIGNVVVGGAAFAVGGPVGAGEGAKVGGAFLSSLVEWFEKEMKKTTAEKLIKLITGEDSVTPLDKQAQKTQDEFELDIFTRAGTDIFEMYECQIVSLQRLAKEGSRLGNLEKLAVEAAKRSFKYLLVLSNRKERLTFSSDMLVDGVIDDKSDGILESLFHLGDKIKTKTSEILVKDIFKKVGVILNKDIQSIHSKRAISHKHGYRLPAPYELKLPKQTTDYYKKTAKPTWKYLFNEEIKESIIRHVKETFEMEGKPQKEKKAMSCKEVEPKNFNVRNPISPCAARTKEVDSLLVWFNEKKGPVLIYAMGGQGKSELCRQFIQKLLQKGNLLIVTWFCGENAAKLLQSVSELARELKISVVDSQGKELTISSLAYKISKKIKTPWVVIIANVDASYSEFNDLIQALSFFKQHVFVVVTSRNSVTLISSHSIDLRELDVKAANEFVKSSIINPSQEDIWVETLCKNLQNYALALQQAVAFIIIKQRREDDAYGIKDYMKVLQIDTISALSKHLDTSEYNKTSFNVFDTTIKELNDSDIILLSILSLVNPDGIKNDFLKKLFAMVEKDKLHTMVEKDKLHAMIKKDGLFFDSLGTLKTFSLIRVNFGVVSIHRLVQIMVQVKMKMKHLENWNKIWSNIIGKLDIKTLDKEEIENLMRIWESVSQTLVRNYPWISECIFNRLHDLALHDLGNYLLTFPKEVYKENEDMFSVAQSSRENREYEENLLKMKVVLEKKMTGLGAKDEKNIEFANLLAFALSNFDLLKESLELQRMIPESYRSKDVIADTLMRQGNHDAALIIFEEILKLKKNLGPKHPEILYTRLYIASCYHCKKMFEKAKNEYEEVLKLMIEVMGKEHVRTIDTRCRLSISLESLGRYKDALDMLKDALIIQEEKNEPDQLVITSLIRSRISELNSEILLEQNK